MSRRSRGGTPEEEGLGAAVPTPEEADLRLASLNKVFQGHDDPTSKVVAVDHVDLALARGQLVTLLGPSGCGKTTLLRMIAGFEEPTEGDIFFGRRRVNELAPNVRDAAMVFQSYAIFPHLDVFENVAFGLRRHGVPRHEIRQRVEQVVALVGLQGMTRRAPSQLSGGQQQRVALARCIVTEPRLLLFDEPLSNLDAKLRDQMRLEIRDLQKRLGITSVYVTHDQVEAMSISDLLVVMNEGRVEQVGSPIEIYARPKNRFVAAFIGKANFLAATKVNATTIDASERRLDVPNGVPGTIGDEVTVLLRPEALTLNREPPEHGALQGRVERTTFLGSLGEVEVDVDGQGSWLVDVPNAAEVGLPQVGSVVGLTPSPRSLHVLPS